MRCVPPAVCATFVLHREKTVTDLAQYESTWQEGAGSLLLLAAAHTAGLVTPHPPTTGESAVIALDPIVSRCGGIAPHVGLTQLHRRCAGLADRTPASVWVPTCGALPFPGSHDGWGRSAHRCARRLHNLPVEGHCSSR